MNPNWLIVPKEHHDLAWCGPGRAFPDVFRFRRCRREGNSHTLSFGQVDEAVKEREGSFKGIFGSRHGKVRNVVLGMKPALACRPSPFQCCPSRADPLVFGKISHEPLLRFFIEFGCDWFHFSPRRGELPFDIRPLDLPDFLLPGFQRRQGRFSNLVPMCGFRPISERRFRNP